jgi:uncharacterized protein (DUF58 family)
VTSGIFTIPLVSTDDARSPLIDGSPVMPLHANFIAGPENILLRGLLDWVSASGSTRQSLRSVRSQAEPGNEAVGRFGRRIHRCSSYTGPDRFFLPANLPTSDFAMRQPILSKYLNPEVLSLVSDRHFDPRGLVIGNLAGAHKSPLSGFAVEFAGHREYVPGDDPKHIDWRVYFNRDKYFVKQYELETNFVCHLLLDISSSMRYGESTEQKLLYGAQLAVTLAYSIVQQSDKVSLGTFDDRVRGFIPPSNSLGQIVRMSHHLDEAQAVEKTDLGECLNDISARMGRREIVMVFSDFFGDLDSLERALQRLRYNRHEVVLFQVLHHDEIAFEFNGMVKFVGLEVSEELLAQPDDLRRGYLAAFQRFQTELQDLSTRNGCEYVLADTRRAISDVLVDYLNQRSRVTKR